MHKATETALAQGVERKTRGRWWALTWETCTDQCWQILIRRCQGSVDFGMLRISTDQCQESTSGSEQYRKMLNRRHYFFWRNRERRVIDDAVIGKGTFEVAWDNIPPVYL